MILIARKVNDLTMEHLNNYLGAFLIAEGTASIAFSKCSFPLWQIGRLIRVGIGLYLYTLPEKK